MSTPYQPNPYGQPGGSDPYQPQTNYSQPYGADPYSGQQPYGSQPYGQVPMQPAYVQPVMAAQPQTNNKAIISLILGICCYAGFGFLTGIPAIIFGHMATREINNSGGTQGGKTLALVGLILGYVATGLTLLACLVGTLFFLGILGAAATQTR